MTQHNMLAIACSVALLSGCGGDSLNTNEPSSVQNPPPIETVLSLGDYTSTLELGEAEAVDVTLPFTGAMNDVAVEVIAQSSVTVSIETNNESVVLSVLASEVDVNTRVVPLTFRISDGINSVSGTLDVTVINTSGEAVLKKIALLKAELGEGGAFSEQVLLMDAMSDLAKYSGGLEPVELGELKIEFSTLLAESEANCDACRGDILVRAEADYQAELIVEDALSEAVTNTISDIESISDDLMVVINKFIVASGRDAFPLVDYRLSVKEGLNAFYGNYLFGEDRMDGFEFSGRFEILNDILLVSKYGCAGEGEENESF